MQSRIYLKSNSHFICFNLLAASKKAPWSVFMCYLALKNAGTGAPGHFSQTADRPIKPTSQASTADRSGALIQILALMYGRPLRVCSLPNKRTTNIKRTNGTHFLLLELNAFDWIAPLLPILPRRMWRIRRDEAAQYCEGGCLGPIPICGAPWCSQLGQLR